MKKFYVIALMSVLGAATESSAMIRKAVTVEKTQMTDRSPLEAMINALANDEPVTDKMIEDLKNNCDETSVAEVLVHSFEKKIIERATLASQDPNAVLQSQLAGWQAVERITQLMTKKLLQKSALKAKEREKLKQSFNAIKALKMGNLTILKTINDIVIPSLTAIEDAKLVLGQMPDESMTKDIITQNLKKSLKNKSALPSWKLLKTQDDLIHLRIREILNTDE